MSYGGPCLGLLACREPFLRKMPGRLVGQTVDRQGKRCWVLTLQTREQHIRREKATSNICTNQGLLALRATVYLAALGPQGLKETAALCTRKAHYAAEQFGRLPGVRLRFGRRTDPADLLRKYGKGPDEEGTDFFLQLFLQGDVPAASRSRLLDYEQHARRQKVPVYWTAQDAADHRVRTLCHLVLTLPE